MSKFRDLIGEVAAETLQSYGDAVSSRQEKPAVIDMTAQAFVNHLVARTAVDYEQLMDEGWDHDQAVKEISIRIQHLKHTWEARQQALQVNDKQHQRLRDKYENWKLYGTPET